MPEADNEPQIREQILNESGIDVEIVNVKIAKPLSENKIQNDSPKFSLIDAISDISVASDFTTHQ